VALLKQELKWKAEQLGLLILTELRSLPVGKHDGARRRLDDHGLRKRIQERSRSPGERTEGIVTSAYYGLSPFREPPQHLRSLYSDP
jgi:hypothetical protein